MLDFHRKESACVVTIDSEPDRLAPLGPASAVGLRGVSVVAAQCCAGISEMRGVPYVEAQTCANPQSAVCIQGQV